MAATEWEPSDQQGYMRRRMADGRWEIKSIETPATGVTIPPTKTKDEPYRPDGFEYVHHTAGKRTA